LNPLPIQGRNIDQEAVLVYRAQVNYSGEVLRQGERVGEHRITAAFFSPVGRDIFLLNSIEAGRLARHYNLINQIRTSR